MCVVYDWTRQETDGFLGHDRCQGQTCGWQARRPEALHLMGGWCGVHTADTARKKTGMRLRLHVGARCQVELHGKKLSKVVEGEVWLLDRSLLMGECPILGDKVIDTAMHTVVYNLLLAHDAVVNHQKEKRAHGSDRRQRFPCLSPTRIGISKPLFMHTPAGAPSTPPVPPRAAGTTSSAQGKWQACPAGRRRP